MLTVAEECQTTGDPWADAVIILGLIAGGCFLLWLFLR